MKDDKNISITRAVGQFFGHLWGASTKPVAKGDEPRKQVLGEQTHEAHGEIDGKKVVVRRTTVDEVEIHDQP